MEWLYSHSEVFKICRLLNIHAKSSNEVNHTQLLYQQPSNALRDFRYALYDYFYQQNEQQYKRIASLSKYVPISVSVGMMTKVLGPVITSGVACAIEPNRGAQLAIELPIPFLTEVSKYLEPTRSKALLQALPDGLINAIAMHLENQHEPIVMASFAANIKQSALKLVCKHVSQPDMILRILQYVDNPETLADITKYLSDEQMASIIGFTEKHHMWFDLLSVLSSINTEMRQLLVDYLSSLISHTLSDILDTVQKNDMWLCWETILIDGSDLHLCMLLDHLQQQHEFILAWENFAQRNPLESQLDKIIDKLNPKLKKYYKENLLKHSA